MLGRLEFNALTNVSRPVFSFGKIIDIGIEPKVLVYVEAAIAWLVDKLQIKWETSVDQTGSDSGHTLGHD